MPIWVPEYHGIYDERADEYAVIGSSLEELTACNNVETPLVVVENKIDE